MGIYTYTRPTTPVLAATSSTFNFQARLMTGVGSIVPDGYYNVEFKLYDGGTDGGPAGTGQANAGTNLWTETYYDSNGGTAGNDNRVQVKSGYLTVNLGSQTAFPGTINWDQELWLTMNIGGTTQTATPTWDGEMLSATNTRIKLTAVPYAFKAGQAANVKSADTNAASTNTDNVSITSGNAAGATSNSGNITIDVGTATQTAGQLLLGTANASALTIGRTGVTTTIQGTAAITGAGTALTVTNSASIGNTLTIGTAGQAGSLAVSDGSSNTVTINTAAQTGDYTLTIPALTSNADICTSANNCTTLGAYIQNQNAGQQATSNFWISGTGRADTGLTAPLLDTSLAVALNIGTTNATQINLNKNVVVAASQSLTVTGGNTASRPGSPTEGMVYYDTTIKQLLTYSNGKWQSDSKAATFVVAASDSTQADKDGAQYVADGEDSSGSGIGTLDGDQIQINAALDAAEAAKGGVVFLAAGTYTVDAAIQVPNNVTLAGTGASTLIQLGNFGGTATNMQAITNKDTSTGTRMVVQDVRIDGRRSINTNGTQYGIYLNGMGGGNGSSARDGAKITNVYIANMRGRGIHLNASSNNIITGNTWQNNVSSGIRLDSSSNNNTITGNISQGNATHGIYIISSSNNNTITGNTMQGNANSGIRLESSSNNNVVSGNKLYDNGSSTTNDSIYITGSDDNTIAGNSINDTAASTNNYAINIVDNTSDKNYLADNRFSSTPGTSTINDAGTGTVYANQARAENGGQLTVRTADDTAAFQVQNAAGTGLLTVDTTNGQTVLRGVQDTPTLGTELVTSQDFSNATYWTCSTGWTTTTTTAQHNTGNTNTCAATNSNFTVTGGTRYEITYTVTGDSSGSNLIPSIGGVSGTQNYNNGTFTTGITAGNTSQLTFTPTSTWNGTISAISVKTSTGTSKPQLTVQNQSGTDSFQLRATSTNLGLGLNSLQYTTSGTYNTAVGISSLQGNTTGYRNTASGYQSLYSNTTGYSNTASGYQSLYDNTTGYSNTASGYQSLYDNTTGYSNTASGHSSLHNNTSGYSNTASGASSLYSNTTGYFNTASGITSLRSNTSGYSNTASGASSLYSNTTGYFNTASGLQSLYSNTTGYFNTASGINSLYWNTTGLDNTALGHDAGYHSLLQQQFQTLNNLQGSTMIGAFSQAYANNVLALGGQGADAISVGINTGLPANRLSAESYRYSTGTVTTDGTANIVGSGTTFTSDMVGNVIYIATNSTSTAPYRRTITAFTDATHITVDSTVPALTNAEYYINYIGLQMSTTGNVGIDTLSPANKLNVNTLTTADSLAQVAISTNGVNNKGLVIQGVAGQGGNVLEIQDSTGLAKGGFTYAGNAFVDTQLSTRSTASGSVNSNALIIKSGNATGVTSNSGDVTIDTGTATGTTGSVLLGSTNASAITLGRSGITTTVSGALGVGSDLTVYTNTILGDASSDRITINGQISGGSPFALQGATDNGFTTTLALVDPTANNVITFPNETGTVCTTGSVCTGYAAAPASGSYLQQVPATSAANTVTPTANSVVGLTINGTSGTAATALAVSQPGAAAGITIASANNTATNGISLSGTFTNYISAPNFSVTNAGVVSASGLINGLSLTQDYIQFQNGGAGLKFIETSGSGSGATNSLSVLTGVSGGAGTSSGDITISTGNGTGTGTDSGDISIDVGTATGSAGTISLGASNVSAITMGRSGITTTNSGSLTVSQLLTGQLGATISGATTSINASSNFATNINTGTSTGAVTIGNSAAGAMSLQSGSTMTLTSAGNMNLNAGTILGNATTQNLFNTVATTVNAFGAATTISVGAQDGVTNLLSDDLNLGYDGTARLRGVGAGGLEILTSDRTGSSDDSGYLYLSSGATSGATSNTGGVYITTGPASSGNSGDIEIDTGTASGTEGAILIGAGNASALELGRTGLTTTNAGALTVAQLLTGQLGATISGATINLNASSNFATNINTGTSTGAVTIGNSAAGAVAIQSASTIGLTGTSTITGLSAGAGTALTVNNSTGTGSIFVAQDNGTAVATIADGGTALFKGSASSATAFQVQNTSNTALLLVDTSSNRVDVGGYLRITGTTTASVALQLNGSNLTVKSTGSSSQYGIQNQAGFDLSTVSGGTLTDLYGMINIADIKVAPATGVTNAYGEYVRVDNSGSATIGNQYGLMVANGNTTNVTNKYGLYIAKITGGSSTNIGLYVNGASGSYFSVAGDGLVRSYSNSSTGFQVFNSSSSGIVLNVDTSNNRLGIGTAASSADLTFGQGADRTINVESRTSNAAGRGLAISAGAAGSGANAFAGGVLTLQGGSAAGTGNANGGNVLITGGAAVGTGVKGLVVIDTPTFTTSATQNCAVDCNITQANIDSTAAVIINATAASLTITMPDPTISTAGRVVYVTAANGSNDFSLAVNGGGVGNVISMRQNTTATMIWNGSDWTAAGASSSTTLQAAYDNTLSSAGGAEIVLNNTATSNGLTVRNNTTTPIIGGIFETQSAIGSNLFSVNNNATEYATNGGAETSGASASTFPANTWDATTTGGTVDRWTTAGDNIATGAASVRVQTTTTNHGARNRISSALTSGLTYSVSFAVRGATNFSTLQVLYSPDGTASGTTQCSTAETVTSGIWTRISCTFVAGGSINSSNSILIRQTDATARTFYIDNLSVSINASATYASDGSVDDAGNFATNWTNYAASGTATMARDTATIYDTSASAEVTTSATAGIGMRNNMSITPSINTQYLVSFYAYSSTTMTSSMAVGFLPAGGTGAPSGTAACTDYNTQSLVASTWTKVTCLFTTTGTAISNPDLVIYQTDASARVINVDALSITLNTNNANNVQIGGSNKGGPTTLFTLDRSDSAPIAANNDAYLGSMYYDTTTGRIQCYEADGWGACGSAPDNIVNLNPEYSGAVLNGTGVGTMTADLCANGGGLTVNTGLCASGEAKNYYKWTSPQATQQTYSIYVSYQLPTTFKGFSSDDTVQLTALVDSTTNAAVTYEMFRSEGGTITQCGSGETAVTSSPNTWQTVGINGNESTGCGFTASSGGAFVMFKINVKANSNANAYVSTLTFTTTGK